MLVTLDDQPQLVEDVYLQHHTRFDLNGLEEEMASLQLDDDVWYEQLRSAESLTIELVDSDLAPVTFDLTRFFGTPFQDEIDNCSDSAVRRRTR